MTDIKVKQFSKSLHKQLTKLAREIRYRINLLEVAEELEVAGLQATVEKLRDISLLKMRRKHAPAISIMGIQSVTSEALLQVFLSDYLKIRACLPYEVSGDDDCYYRVEEDDSDGVDSIVETYYFGFVIKPVPYDSKEFADKVESKYNKKYAKEKS